MSHERPLPNPFVESDARSDRLEQCEKEIADLHIKLSLLMQGQTLLMKLKNDE